MSAAVDLGTSVPTVHDAVYAKRLLTTVILGVVAFSSSMTIVSAVLADIAEDLGSTPSTVSWAVTGLFLMSAIGTPVMGRLGDAIGRHRVFVFGTTTVAIGTILCIFAWNAGAFIAFRMITGIGIACTMPNGMAMIIDAHPPERRSVALGWFQMVMAGAPVFALIVGAALTEAFGWRSVFVLLTPMAVSGAFLAARNVRPTPATGTVASVDWCGAAALGATTFSFLMALERVKATSVTNWLVFALLGMSACAGFVFVMIERRVVLPLLRLDYFRRRNFTGPLIAQPLGQFAYMGGFVMAPLLLKSVFGLGIAASSWVLLFRPAVFSVSSPIAGRLATRFGARSMILTGGALVTVSMGGFAVGARIEALWLIVAALIASGLGMGLATSSYATSVAAAVDPTDLGVASGMSSTIMNIGTLTGIQTMFVVLGDSRSPHMFGTVFGVGAAVAAVGLIGGLIMSPKRAVRPRFVERSPTRQI